MPVNRILLIIFRKVLDESFCALAQGWGYMIIRYFEVGGTLPVESHLPEIPDKVQVSLEELTGNEIYSQSFAKITPEKYLTTRWHANGQAYLASDGGLFSFLNNTLRRSLNLDHPCFHNDVQLFQFDES